LPVKIAVNYTLGVKNGYPVVPWALVLTSAPLRRDA